MLLGKDRPKEVKIRTTRVKLDFGEEIRAVDLPLPAEMPALVGLVREEFDTEMLDLRYTPSTVCRVEVTVFSARHLPKADRAGLCDAVVHAEITPSEAYCYTGYHTTPRKSRTRIVHKSLSPDFDEQLTLLLDGTGDPEKHGLPRLKLTLSDWDDGEEEMVGQLDLDLAHMMAVTARTRVWQRQEDALREQLAALQTEAVTGQREVQQQRAAQELALQRASGYLADCRAKALAAFESFWGDLRWVDGCIPSTKVRHDGSAVSTGDGGGGGDGGREGGGEAEPRAEAAVRGEEEEGAVYYVRGADKKLASLRVGVKVVMTEYQDNCWLNWYYPFSDNVMEQARGWLQHHTDDCKRILREKKVSRTQLFSAGNMLVATEGVLQKLGIADASQRQVILRVI